LSMSHRILWAQQSHVPILWCYANVDGFATLVHLGESSIVDINDILGAQVGC